MHNKIVNLFSILCLIVAAMVFSATPAAALNGQGGQLADCQDLPNISNFAGGTSGNPKNNDPLVAGVRGRIFYSTDASLLLCENPIAFGNSGSSVWIAVTGDGGPGEIIQIGLFRGQGTCAPTVPCDEQIHLFWAWGNQCGPAMCGGPNGLGPEPYDLGLVPAGSGTIYFAIQHYCDQATCDNFYGNDQWRLFYNFTTPPNVETDTPAATINDSVAPWAGGLQQSNTLDLEIACETTDRSNQCGGYGNNLQGCSPQNAPVNGSTFVTQIQQSYWPTGPFVLTWNKPKPTLVGFRTYDPYHYCIQNGQTSSVVLPWTENR